MWACSGHFCHLCRKGSRKKTRWLGCFPFSFASRRKPPSPVHGHSLSPRQRAGVPGRLSHVEPLGWGNRDTLPRNCFHQGFVSCIRSPWWPQVTAPKRTGLPGKPVHSCPVGTEMRKLQIERFCLAPHKVLPTLPSQHIPAPTASWAPTALQPRTAFSVPSSSPERRFNVHVSLDSHL
ncbi:uncharacterized protein LOC120228212 isoform X3 [Hyaena hyaena]|uniref:uncharacterized protein LOC120228212 isoform X3 n=1 Tax=Hyaena hyaena TaxID=95912 RepID=UPI00192412B8|nr:uncharacterized protein LOC120228212 isoform X3 [Hyaena hyaena]